MNRVPTSLILAAMAVAATTLAGIGVAWAAGAFDDAPSGPPGSVSGSCSKHLRDSAEEALHDDLLLDGVVAVGFVQGTTHGAAIRFLEAQDTSFNIPQPYRRFAYACVRTGYEQMWINQFRARPDVVEYAHREGFSMSLLGRD